MKTPYGSLEPAERQGRIFAQVSATLWSYWREAEGYQRFLYVLGALLLSMALLHTIVLLVTGGSLQGAVSWRQPIMFGEAFGVTLLSLGYIIGFLPIRRIVGWVLSGIVGIASAGEVLLISVQQWRGVPSHFNSSTPFDAAVFGAMGILVAFIEIVIIVLAVWTWVSLEAVSATQAFRGLAPLDLALVPGLIVVGSSIVMVSAYVITLRALVGSARARAG